MRRAILLLAFCGVASAQLTTVQGLIQLATGATPSGTLTLANQYFVSPTGAVVPAASIVVPIVNGVINPPSGIPIFPNVGSTPSGTSYSATYALSGLPVYQRKWYVPQSNTPVNVVNVEYPSQGNVGQSAIINPVQIVPAGAVPGNCLVFNGNLWLPGTCSGGGASSAFNTITSGTNTTAAMLVGTGASLGFTGSGTVAANTILTTPITALRGNSGILAQATGAFTSGNLRSSDASSNEIDSGIPGANVIVSTGSYANPSWITSLAASKLTGGFGCSAMPALTGDVGSSAGSCVVTVIATNGNPFAQSAIINALNASNISSGTLAAARLPAINLAASGAGGVTGNLPVTNLNGGTGASSTTAWFGDGTWKSIAAGGTVTNSLGPLTAGAVVIGNSGNDETVLPSLGTTTTVLHGNAGGNPSWGSVVLTTDVSGVLPGANGGLGTASIIFSGPSGTAKTFTLPNVSSTILTSNAAVTLAQGGNGANFSAIALGGLLTGTGAGTMGLLTASTNGFVLTLDSGQTNGMKWANPTSGGTVTSIATTFPLTGGPITTSGTIACAACTLIGSPFTANQLIIGGASNSVMSLGSLGTTTTVLHGNNAGTPSFAPVSLTADVSGVLPVANGGIPTNIDTPENHGCIGNGTTDDTTCMQAAFTAVDGTGKVLWAGNTYKITGTPTISVGNFTLTGGGKFLINAAASSSAYINVGGGSATNQTTTTTNLPLANRMTAATRTIGVGATTGMSVGSLILLNYNDGTYLYNQYDIVQSISGSNVTMVDPILVPLVTTQTNNVQVLSAIPGMRISNLTFDCSGSSGTAVNTIGILATGMISSYFDSLVFNGCNSGTSQASGLFAYQGHGNHFSNLLATNSGSANVDALAIWNQSFAVGDGIMAFGNGNSSQIGFCVGFHFNVGSNFSNVTAEGCYQRQVKLQYSAYTNITNVNGGNSANATLFAIAFNSYRNHVSNLNCELSSGQGVGLWFDGSDDEWNLIDGVNCFGSSTADIQFNSGNHNNQVINAAFGTLSDGSADASNRVSVVNGAQSQVTFACSGTASSSTTLILNLVGGACTNASFTSAAILEPTTQGYIQNLRVTSSTNGSASGSGAVTIFNSTSGTSVTCTIGNASSTCTDSAHRAAVNPGDNINVRITTGAGETLSNLVVTFEM